MPQITDRITEWIVKTKKIKQSDRILYEAGLRQAYSLLLDAVGILMLGCAFHLLKVAIALSFLFMILQRYAGSYHAATRLKCYMGSMAMIAVNLYIFKNYDLPCTVQCIVVPILLIIIAALAPVESRNKKLDAIEKKVYHIRAVKICCLYGVIWFGVFLLKMEIWAKVFMFTVVDIVVLQLIGRVDLLVEKKKITNPIRRDKSK